MEEYNVGTLDRIIRVFLGLGLIYLSLYINLSVGMMWLSAITGLILIVTGISSLCLVYKILKLSTCKANCKKD